MKLFVLLISILIFSQQLVAQNEGTLTLMNDVPQSGYNNPAFMPRYNVSIGLPGSSVMGFYSNNGFSYNKVITRANDSVKIDLNKLSSTLKPKNYITQAAQVDFFRLGIRATSKLYINLNVSAKAYSRFLLPKDITSLVSGTTSYVGKTVSVSPAIDAMAYVEAAIGAAYSINPDFTFGARVKVLKGIFDVNTQNSNLAIAVDKNTYAVTANASVNVRTSGIYDNNSTSSGNGISDYLKNNGLAFDLGATYRIQKKLTLGLSLLDIGGITWTNNTYSYSLNPATANYTFQGIDLSKTINNKNNNLSAQGDSIQKRFSFKETATGSYRAAIPSKIYASGVYEIKKNFTAGAIFSTENFRGRIAPALTLGVNRNFGRWFSASGSYTIASNTFNNIGLGASLNLGFLQVYVVGDNLLRIPLSGFSNFVNNTQYFNVRTGVNFNFGIYKPKAFYKEIKTKKNTAPFNPEKK